MSEVEKVAENNEFMNLGPNYIFPIALWKFVWPEAPNESMVKWVYDAAKADNESGVGVDQLSVFSERYGIKRPDSFNQTTNEGGWQSNTLTDEETGKGKEFNPLLKFVSFMGDEVAKTVGIEQVGMELSMWANLNRPHDYNTIHTHPGCHFSGVYYAKVPKGDCGDLVVYNPSFWSSVWLPPDGDLHGNTKTPDGMKYNCESEENVCYVFRSNVMHEVSRNNTKEDRISFAFNIKYILP